MLVWIGKDGAYRFRFYNLIALNHLSLLEKFHDFDLQPLQILVLSSSKISVWLSGCESTDNWRKSGGVSCDIWVAQVGVIAYLGPKAKRLSCNKPQESLTSLGCAAAVGSPTSHPGGASAHERMLAPSGKHGTRFPRGYSPQSGHATWRLHATPPLLTIGQSIQNKASLWKLSYPSAWKMTVNIPKRI